MREIPIGLIGLGTVGEGVVRLLTDHGDLIASRLGARLTLARVADLRLARAEALSLPPGLVTRDAAEVLADPTVPIVIELIGGLEPARSYILTALAQGKHVVTANKALLAEHGDEIFATAARHERQVAFEASVGGGIPIVRALRDGFVAERVQAIYGIINGTSNYILSEMTEHGGRFAAVLKKAQEKGYAEADPNLDVGGIDSAHKLVLLVRLAFGASVPLADVYTEGITEITPLDIAFARELGYTIKLLAMARREGRTLDARVHPTMIPSGTLLATVGGVFNAISVHGAATGPCLFYGRGAGMMPTAAAVLADVVDLAGALLAGGHGVLRGGHLPAPDPLTLTPIGDTENVYYLRFSVVDRPGVLSKISGVLGDHRISIASMIQQGRKVEGAVPIVMMTHEARERDMHAALAIIDKLPVVLGKTMLVRVETGLG